MILEKIEALSETAFSLTFADGTLLRCGVRELSDLALRPGEDYGDAALSAIREACGFYAVRQKAAQLISRQAMSAGEVRRKLTEKGASPEHAEAAAAWLLDIGAIDEGSYAAMVVRHYAAKGYGRRRVENELYRHLVPREYWETALEALPEAEETLDRLIQLKLRGMKPDEGQIRKLRDSLCRRGYSWEAVRAAIARNTEYQDDD